MGRQTARSLVTCVPLLAAMGLVCSGVFAKDPPASAPSDRDARLAARHESHEDQEAADLFRTADTTFLVGDLNRAVELFQKVLTSYPSCSYTVRAQARLADCDYELRKYTEAAGLYRRAAAAGESAAGEEEKVAGVRADYMVGHAYLQAKLYTQAFSQFRRFIDRHAGHALVNNAYQAIGDAHLALEQHQQALAAYRMVGTVIGEKSAAHRRISPGQRLYLRVTDADVNVGETPRTVFAKVKSTSGDTEIVELDPLGQRSPMFMATLPTALGAPRISGKITDIFAEAMAARLRAQLTEADKQEKIGRAKAVDAEVLDRSPQKTVDPAGTETKRAALVAESERLLNSSKALRADACRNIDTAYAALENTVAEWAPDQSLATLGMGRVATTTSRPSSAPVAKGEDEETINPTAAFEAAAVQALGGAEEEEAGPTTAPSGDTERRGMTENEILQVRRGVAKAPTGMENIDSRLTTLSIWSRSLHRQFQRMELCGKDQIEIEYFDEVGPNGPNAPGTAIRKDVVEVASDATIAMLTRDGREPLQQIVVNSDVMLQVEDFDGDVSDQPDTLTVVLAAVPIADRRLDEVRSAGATSEPTSQRATPGEVAAGDTEVKTAPLVPEGAASIKITLTETGPHTGVFQKVITVTEKGVKDGDAALPITTEQSKGNLCALRMAYVDAKGIRHPDGWVLAASLDCVGDTGGSVAAVKYRQTPLDMEAKLQRAVAAGEIGKIYLDLGLTRRGREYLSSAQADCDEVAKAGDKSKLGEEALYHSWRIYFYAGLLDEAVASCRTLMARYPNSEHIDAAMFAMGEASLDRGEKEVEQEKENGGKAAMNRDLSRAVEQFEDLVRRFPKSSLAPESLFMVGRAKIAAGQTGLDTFERLAKQYPDSVLAARGLAKVAEYYVSIADHRRAADYYGRVLMDYPDSPDLGHMLLQRGICQYKLGQNGEALQSLYRVAEEQGGTELATEAHKYINLINQKRGGKNE